MMSAQRGTERPDRTRARVYLGILHLLFAVILILHLPVASVPRVQSPVFVTLSALALALLTLPGRQVAAAWFIAMLTLGDLAVLLYTMPNRPVVELWTVYELLLLTVTAAYAPTVQQIALLSSLVAGAYAVAFHRVDQGEVDQLLLLPVLLCVTMAFTSKTRAIQTELDRMTETEEQTRFKTMVDALTGLPNRAQFMDRVARSIQYALADRNFQFAVLFIDLDGFKPINDRLGHKAGDTVLRHAAKRFQACLRKGDVVGRYGGDEFTLLINHISGDADAIRVAERVLAKLKEPIDVGEPVTVGASIGIALSTNLHERPEDLIRDADGAMYRAKGQGKNQYIFSDQIRDIPKDELKDRWQRVVQIRR